MYLKDELLSYLRLRLGYTSLDILRTKHNYFDAIVKKDDLLAQNLLAHLKSLLQNMNNGELDDVLAKLNMSLFFIINDPHENKIELFKAVLDFPGIDINFSYCRSPLHTAIMRNNQEVLNILLDRDDLNVNLVDSIYGTTPLIESVEQINKEMVRALLQRKDINPNISNRVGDTPLICSIKNSLRYPNNKNCIEICEALMKLDWYPKPEEVNRLGLLLIRAVEEKREDIIKLLLQVKSIRVNTTDLVSEEVTAIDVNIRDKDGRTPLMIAVMKGSEAIIDLLLYEKNIEINAVDKNNETALILAIKAYQPSPVWLNPSKEEEVYKDIALKILKMPNIDVNIVTIKEGDSALFFAKYKQKLVQALLKIPTIELNICSFLDKYTPLVRFMKDGDLSGLNAILSIPDLTAITAAVNKANQLAHEPLIWAAKNNFPETLNLILALPGINIDIVDSFNQKTPLICAIQNGHKYIVELLLQAGAAYNLDIALIDAAKKGHKDVVELFLELRAGDYLANKQLKEDLICAAKDVKTLEIIEKFHENHRKTKQDPQMKSKLVFFTTRTSDRDIDQMDIETQQPQRKKLRFYSELSNAQRQPFNIEDENNKANIKN